ncbi:Peptidase M14 carboxypeptidase A [Trinorchestia longiramus]|nr:Peptidase M14 carboxypeptidase A [Trinorchestia longiramus]
MGWGSHNGVFLAILLLALSSTIAQDGLEQTTLSAVAQSDTEGPGDTKTEESSAQASPDNGIIESQSQSTEDSVIANLNENVAEEKDESDGSTNTEVQMSKPAVEEERNRASSPNIEESEIIAQTTPSQMATEEIVEHTSVKDKASNTERPSLDRFDKNQTQIEESEIAEPTDSSHSLVEIENEGQKDVKLLLQAEDDFENSGIVAQPEDNTVGEPDYVSTEKVDYSSWRVYKVEGFGSRLSSALRDQSGTDENNDNEDVDMLVQLEENPRVRVLHENQLLNFFQIAISPDADSRADVLASLESRGFTVQDIQIDLGTLITESEDGVFRAELPKGAVTFDSYMTYEQIEEFIIEFANLHPQMVTRSEIGMSVEGRSIHMLTLTLGPGSTQKLARQSRQVSNEPEQSYPAVDATLKALERIIRWSDSQAEDKVLETEHELQDEKPQKLSEKVSGTRRSEDAPPPGFLEHMIYNMPYDVVNENEPSSGVVSDTYSTLNKIINITQNQDDDYALIDFPNEPPEIQITYKVLQKIMNYDQDDRASKILSHLKEIGDIDIGSNRIAKSLDVEETESENETDAGITGINEEAEILFIVTSIIPSEYADNKTMIDSISDSVRIIMRTVPKGVALTDEVVQRIAPQIVQIPGVVGIASDSTGSKSDLVSKLGKILSSRNALLSSNQFLDTKDQDTEATLRAASNKPVIFIDGGIHAREWISPAFLMYAATQLVENTDLLLGAEWQLVPVLNPDGYVHTWKKDRMWRKNRRSGSQWCRGVDLNRNFGYKHGGKGSSSNHCSEIYRGPTAFSEPESQAVRTAVESVKDRLKAYLTVHSYGQMILHPWGYDNEIHPDSDQMAIMGEGMSNAIRSVNGQKYVVGGAAEVLYPAAGGSDDWVSSLGVPYSFTLELRDTGSKGFILPASQILPTVKETWAGVKYLGQQVIQENPRLKSATAPTALSQTGLDMLSALQGVGITSSQGDSIMQSYPSLVPVDYHAPNRFRSGIQEASENPTPAAYPAAPLIPIFGLGTSNFNFGDGHGQRLSGVALPNAHFKQTSNSGFPGNDFASQLQHGIVVLETDPTSSSGPALLSHFAQPAFQNNGFQNQKQSSHPTANQGQIQSANKFRDSLQERQPDLNPTFSLYPFVHQNFQQYNIPYPALQPVPQFLPGIHAESQVGGSVVPYNSPMVIKPSFFNSGSQNDQMSFRFQPSTFGSQAHQVSKFSFDETQPQPFNPSFRISNQPFRPILQPLPSSPAQAQFKTNIHAVTASEFPEAEPKFAHPFLDSPNILVSLGSPQRPDPNAFRYEIPQNGRYSIAKYPRAIRHRGLPTEQ